MQTLMAQRLTEDLSKITITENKCLEYKCPEPCSRLRRQTHMHCIVCQDVAEFYDQICCYKCGNSYKWSVPWKNERKTSAIN
jgi:hypothetical protein